MPRRRRRNPLNWERQSGWFEAEGSKPRVPRPRERFHKLITVSQDIARQEIVDTLCNELKAVGFHTETRISNRTKRCELVRLEEQNCFIERTRPHYIAKETQTWAQQYIDTLKRQLRRRPRIPFPCPT